MSQTTPHHKGFELFVLQRRIGVQAGIGVGGVWNELEGEMVLQEGGN